MMWRRMLDDDALAEPLLLALGAGIKAEQLRSLARRSATTGTSSTVACARRSLPARSPSPTPGRSCVGRSSSASGRSSAATTATCFLGSTCGGSPTGRARWRARPATASGSALVRDATSGRRPAHGRSRELARSRRAEDRVQGLDRGRRVRSRRRSPRPRCGHSPAGSRSRCSQPPRSASHPGRLEFHDLLVASRDLLRRDADARAALQATYQRLLLDEFQDTDPIQIELAVRIAGGAGCRCRRLAGRRRARRGRCSWSATRSSRSTASGARASRPTSRAGEAFGRRVSLVTNFRTVPPVLDWVNGVFGAADRRGSRASSRRTSR